MYIRNRLIVPAVLAALLGPSAWAAGNAPAPAGEPASAVWTEKELSFTYQGFTTKYSCDGLRDKVRGVLLDLGAQKKGLKVMELGCIHPSGPDPFPGVRVKMRVLQLAGSPDAAKAADQTPVAAHWQPVDLKLQGSSFSNDSGECELIEQIRHNIVPLFATRNVDLQTTCIPHQTTAARPKLKMEVLVADDPKQGAVKQGAAPQ